MVMPFHSPEVANPDVMLARYPILRILPAALAGLGHDVTVLIHAALDAQCDINTVRYEFICPPRYAVWLGEVIHRRKPRYGPAYYQPATRLVRRLEALAPDVVHFFGLTMDIQLALVARLTARMRIPLVVHFHGGAPAQSWKRRPLQRYNQRRIARVLFTTRQQADLWVSGGLGLAQCQVELVLETSSPFRGLEKAAARSLTGMRGDPVYLSAGRLHPVKDPLTMLEGFARIQAAQPGARLYLYYLSDEILAQVRSFLEQQPDVNDVVELRGRVELEEMEAVYSSADFLLQASLREWSGLAIVEAMSCGCIPIVSDIPAFAMMTEGGTFGRLFDTGDAHGLASAALGISTEERRDLSAAVRRHFEEQLSFAAMAREIDRVYCAVTGD